MKNRIEQRIQDGQHLALIVDSRVERIGGGLVISFAVMDADYNVVRLERKMDTTSDELDNLCRAVGVFDPKDSSELHGASVFIGIRDGKIVGYGCVERELSRMQQLCQ